MSHDRDPVDGARPERWLVPTDDDEQMDVPAAPRGRHHVPEAEDAAATPETADVPTAAAPQDPASAGAGQDLSAWRSDDARTELIPVVPAEPDLPLLSGRGVPPTEDRTALIPPVPAEPTPAVVAAAYRDDDSGGVRVPPSGGRAAAKAARAAEQRRPRTAGDHVRTVVRGIGQTLITLGVVVLLFVVYEIWITDIFSAQKQKAATAALEERWVQDQVQQTEVVTVTDPNQLIVDPATRERRYQVLDGEGFAKISIPAFGPDYHYTIISGTNPDELTTGPGHYPDSQYPGEQGNFAIAGHRVSKGSPFNALDALNSCDAIIIETQHDWFVYRVLPMQDEIAGWDPAARAGCEDVEVLAGEYSNVVGREITLPTDYAQVLPVPHKDSTAIPEDAERLITLTTCHPQFSDAERMIVHGVLVKTYSKAGDFVPPEMLEG